MGKGLHRKPIDAIRSFVDTATKLIWKANLKPGEIAELTAKVQRLRFGSKSA